jgi:UDP-N-acetylglucosamine--N-acetylmuramyl-(pentapeptide) pyrophosphoryl-undecaprenol N-acetylglucosamine transferase
VPQAEFTAENLAQRLQAYTRHQLLAMAQAARDAAKPDATAAVAQVCMELAA